MKLKLRGPKLKNVILYATLATTFAIGGDHYNIEKRLFGKLYEEIWPAEQGYRQNYMSLEICYERTNNKTKVFLYDRSTHEKRRVNADLTTGTLEDMLSHIFKEGLKQGYYESKEFIEKSKEKTKNATKDIGFKLKVMRDYIIYKAKNFFYDIKHKFSDRGDKK